MIDDLLLYLAGPGDDCDAAVKTALEFRADVVRLDIPLAVGLHRVLHGEEAFHAARLIGCHFPWPYDDDLVPDVLVDGSPPGGRSQSENSNECVDENRDTKAGGE